MINQKHNLQNLTLAFLLLGIFMVPSFALAAKSSRVKNINKNFVLQTTMPATATDTDYSAQLTQARDKIIETMTDQKTKVLDQTATQAKQLAVARTTADEETKQARATYDATMDKTYTDLQKKASIPVEKRAVEKFNAVVRGAVTTRRGVVDTATNNYRQGFDGLMVTKVTNLTGAIDDYVATATSTIDQAQTDLAHGVQTPVVKQYVKTNISAAEQKLKQVENTSYDKELNKLEADRANTVQKADKDLTQTLNKSQQDLRSAFGGKL